MLHRRGNAPSAYWQLLPIGGMVVFLVLYGVAAAWYPGGSLVNKASPGFSWLHNYWCNLLHANALNGQPNPARPVALLAMGILGASLTYFWYLLPNLFNKSFLYANTIRFAGILAMLFASFIFTEYHDLVITVAGLFGLVALAGTFVGLYQARLRQLLGLGLVCMALLLLNNYVYYTTHFIYYLPVIQKLTLLIFLTWLSLLTIKLYRQASR